jgi:sulfur relay (sulfurtransferase) complex TusBCD TusD component (DsrE family)
MRAFCAASAPDLRPRGLLAPAAQRAPARQTEVAVHYLLIQTDAFERRDGTGLGLAELLADGTHDVAVYLVQNAVLGARRSAATAPALEQLAQSATVLADDFSLRERGVRPDELAAGVSIAGIDSLAELLVDDRRRAIWQ